MSDTVVRVVTLPIRAVLDADTFAPAAATVIDTFRPGWRLCTDLANWAWRQLALRDVLREPGMDRYPRYDRKVVFGEVVRTTNRKATGGAPAKAVGDPQEGSVYRLFCDEYPGRAAWDGAAVVARDVLKAVEQDWAGHKTHGRYAVMWKGSASVPYSRFPHPYPVASDKGKTLRIMRDGEGRPVASIPFPGSGGRERVAVRLADGGEFRRQLQKFDWLLANIGRLKQGKVTGRRAGGRLVGADLRLVGAFDRVSPTAGVSATVRTGPEALWRAVVDGDEGNPVVRNADHLVTLRVVHDRWAYRVRQDGVLRRDDDRRRAGGSMVRARFDKAKNRNRTAVQQEAAELVRALRRRGVNSVDYDDTDTSFGARPDGRSGLDWTLVREVLTCECEEHGISLQHLAGGDDAE